MGLAADVEAGWIVLKHRSRRRPDSGLDRYTTYLDPVTSRLHERVERFPWLKVVVTRGLDAEEAAAFSEEHARRGIQHTVRLVGSRQYLTAYCETEADIDRLPYEHFILHRNRCLTPRTISLSERQIDLARATLDRLGFRETRRYTEAGREFRFFTYLNQARLEMSPMTGKEFRVFAENVEKESFLRRLFQLHTYESRPFAKHDEAKAYRKELIAKHQANRWFYFNLDIVKRQRGLQFKRDVHVIRARSSEAEPKELLAEGFEYRGLGCHKLRSDTAQLDEQRTWHELEQPVLHHADGSALTVDQLRAATKSIEDVVCAIDLETLEYLKDRLGPRPSGYPVHGVLRSGRERLLFVVKEYSPPEPDVDGYRIVACEDPLDLVRKLDAACAPYAYVFGHNIKGFDRGHLTIWNSRITVKDEAHWLRTHKRHLPPPVAADADRFERFRQDIHATTERVNGLRAKHAVRGRVWTHQDFIDTLSFFSKRLRLRGGLSLEALTGETKREDYEKLYRNFIERTPEGLHENCRYTADDAENSWKLVRLTLPALVAEAAAVGRQLDHVANSQSYQNMLRFIGKQVASHGKIHRSHYAVRDALQRLESAEKTAVHHFMTYRLGDGRPRYREAGLYCNPLVLASLEPLLAGKRGIRAMLDAAEGPFWRSFAQFAAASYLAPVLLSVHETMQAARLPLGRAFPSADAFYAAAERGKGSAERYLGAELALPRDFSLGRAWEALHGTYCELQSIAADADLSQAGPFLLGELPSEYGRFRLGDANACVLRHGRLLAAVNTQDGWDFLSWGVRIPKADNGLREAVVEGFGQGKPLAYRGCTQSVDAVCREAAALQRSPQLGLML